MVVTFCLVLSIGKKCCISTLDSMAMLVLLSSPKGKERLEEVASSSTTTSSSSTKNNTCDALQQEIIDSFRKQRGNTVCGLASLAVVFTARNRALMKAKRHGNEDDSGSTISENDLFVDEDDVYPMAEVVKKPRNDEKNYPSKIVEEKKIRISGMTLDQARYLVEAIPSTAAAIAFSPASEIDSEPSKTTLTPNHRKLLQTIDDLRKLLIRVLSKPSSSEGLILNYHMGTLGQFSFGGHLSPLAAYHEATDSVLIMDVWHTQTEPVWAPLSTVWTAVKGIDAESQCPRGLLHIVHKEE